MKAIANLEITRYQGHKNTSMALHPNVNIILGPSDVGKSTIVRAINWVSTNRPIGDDYRMDFGKGDTEVGVEFVDESYVLRRKGTSFNGYEADGKDLKALRTDVPLEVKEIMQMDEENQGQDSLLR